MSSMWLMICVQSNGNDWKVHFSWVQTKYHPVLKYSTSPKVVDLIRDPRETRQVAKRYNAWLQFTALPLVGMLQASMKKFPNIPVGVPNDFVPNYATNLVVEKPAAR